MVDINITNLSDELSEVRIQFIGKYNDEDEFPMNEPDEEEPEVIGQTEETEAPESDGEEEPETEEDINQYLEDDEEDEEEIEEERPAKKPLNVPVKPAVNPDAQKKAIKKLVGYDDYSA